MTLNEKVSQYIGKDVTLHIGSDSAYFWIGKPEDFDKEIDALTEKWYHYFEDVFRDADNGLYNFMHTPIKPAKMGTAEMATPKQYLVTLESKMVALKQNIESVQVRQERLDGFEQFRERRVTDCYNLMKPGHIAIIVTGSESGPVWNEDEWQNEARRVPHCEVRGRLSRKEWGKYATSK